MAIVELFSTRQKHLRGEIPDVYVYDKLPRPLRTQIVHIWREAFGEIQREGYGTVCPVLKTFREIDRVLSKEFGTFSLFNSQRDDAFTGIANFFLDCQDFERSLDVVQLTFQFLKFGTNNYKYSHSSLTSVTGAITELNERFLQHGVGYAFDNDINTIVRIDSQFLHVEAVKPALSILTAKRFRSASEEFAKAHEHYRQTRYQECIADCLKAFESVLKVICTDQHWGFDSTDTAKTLIKVCFEHGLIPSYLESEFSSLRTLLESGVPTIRNKTSGHGQGATRTVVPQHLAAYALHLTASNIVFLATCEKALR